MNKNLSFIQCFSYDENSVVPVPIGFVRKIYGVMYESRYSMVVLMRLTQYFYKRFGKIGVHIARIISRKNQKINNFEHGVENNIESGIIFHHTGVAITSNTVIEKGVHIYRNVLLGSKNGCAPHIKKYAKICSHSIVLGGVVIGEKAVVAPGAIVTKSVPDYKVVVGVNKILCDVDDENYKF